MSTHDEVVCLLEAMSSNPDTGAMDGELEKDFRYVEQQDDAPAGPREWAGPAADAEALNGQHDHEFESKNGNSTAGNADGIDLVRFQPVQLRPPGQPARGQGGEGRGQVST